MTAVRELRESAVHYRNGRAAARVAAGYAGLVVLVAVGVVFADLGLGGHSGGGTVLLLAVTLPGSVMALGVLSAMPGLPATSGTMSSALTLLQVALLTGAGLGQSWVLWRLGRGPRRW